MSAYTITLKLLLICIYNIQYTIIIFVKMGGIHCICTLLWCPVIHGSNHDHWLWSITVYKSQPILPRVCKSHLCTPVTDSYLLLLITATAIQGSWSVGVAKWTVKQLKQPVIHNLPSVSHTYSMRLHKAETAVCGYSIFCFCWWMTGRQSLVPKIELLSPDCGQLA